MFSPSAKFTDSRPSQYRHNVADVNGVVNLTAQVMRFRDIDGKLSGTKHDDADVSIGSEDATHFRTVFGRIKWKLYEPLRKIF